MSKDNGGPAFPFAPMTETGNAGMSMRDYFAAAALMGIHANPKWETDNHDNGDTVCDCYAIADAMIEERRK